MKILRDISLKPYNTFGIEVKASQFIEIINLDQLYELVSKKKDFFVLGGGSNLLLTKPIEKLVLHLAIKGISIIKENDDAVYIKANAGENWHELVKWCIDKNFGGLENLSLIPGNVGTAPIQNIGAYGVELKDVMHELEALEIATNKTKIFKNKDCDFGYRNSIFKNGLKGKFIITSVIFKLSKEKHKLNDSYGAIQSELGIKNIKDPTIKDISAAVIAIRQSKLPDPKKLGNSGSFFKNPVISKRHFNLLAQNHKDIPSYSISKTEIKVPAGWLVEQCGFKGKRFGDAGVHKKQALVLVNYGNASGEEILALSKLIQQKVYEKFEISLDPEVNII